ncbi:GNAT family N-acetyltransferase [Halomonas sp. IOP_31]|uniref:GNAT family N-acetyltransferase n=1 Tax=Halomonas sp. IOP_31 TaxID=2876584 RepID=UPI001E5924A1|nr:GNAT family N-acetyltransferase [Halomonas sp. IOP_31]MCD6009489.1 GNAT family N-acetyltransferase [Halomonas sp. IOP_31]
MQITPITPDDFALFWPTFKAVVESRETYAFDPEITFDDAYALWCKLPQLTYVAKEDGVVLGSYYLKPNAAGPGDHVCNCGYMVAPEARGKGVARALCLHSQDQALEAGYQAMQFNAVVATNEAAIGLWQSLGFNIIGTVPGGYRHARHGLVDTHIMHKALR